MRTRTIDIKNPEFPSWTRLNLPTVECPYWHDDGGQPIGYAQIVAGMTAEQHAGIDALHLSAINTLAATGLTLARQGREGHGQSRRLIAAASRLLEEAAGLWPAATRTPLR
jgi:hypothetical protein